MKPTRTACWKPAPAYTFARHVISDKLPDKDTPSLIAERRGYYGGRAAMLFRHRRARAQVFLI